MPKVVAKCVDQVLQILASTISRIDSEVLLQFKAANCILVFLRSASFDVALETRYKITLKPILSGDVAQLVEYFHGMEGVLGSNPCISTILITPTFR